MDDKDFYEEVVNRFTPPIKTTTMKHMINIVYQNTLIPIADMFPDKGLDDILKNDQATYNAYKFIRDNQNLYVNSELINNGKIDEILYKSEDKVIEHLKEKKYCYKENQMILNNVIYRIKPKIIKYLLEQDILPNLNTTFFLYSLLLNAKSLNLVKMIEKKGVNLLSISSGKLLNTAILNNNIEGTQYLIKNAPLDMYIVKESLKKYIEQEYEENSKFKATKDKFQEISENMIPIINILLNNLSKESISNIIHNCTTQEMKEFLSTQSLFINLENSIALKELKSNNNKCRKV